MFLFFSVARSAQIGQAERASEAHKDTSPLEATKGSGTNLVDDVNETTTEKMPTDKLLDVSPLALRMSSPFNAGYWLATS
jgi:hypothetical protein